MLIYRAGFDEGIGVPQRQTPGKLHREGEWGNGRSVIVCWVNSGMVGRGRGDIVWGYV